MKTVLITGGSRGLGAACARLFSQQGWRVVINYNQSAAEAKALAETTGAYAVQADVSNAADVEKLAATLKNIGYTIDCLINNAGISQERLFSDITEQDWDRMFNINVKSIFLVTKAFLPDMLKKQKGSIVNISSIWGETGAAMEVHYSASKAAVIGLTKALAKELAPSNIRVNCVAPGYVDTQMNSRYTSEEVAQITDQIPLCRIGVPEEIAKVIEFLASDAASYITGQVIAANGGWHI